MKLLLLVIGIGALVGAVAVGCGPQKAYCPNAMSGLCEADAGSAPPMPDTGLGGESVVIGTD